MGATCEAGYVNPSWASAINPNLSRVRIAWYLVFYVLFYVLDGIIDIKDLTSDRFIFILVNKTDAYIRRIFSLYLTSNKIDCFRYLLTVIATLMACSIFCLAKV